MPVFTSIQLKSGSNHPNLDDLYHPNSDDLVSHPKFCISQIWMILNMLASHPKVDVSYNPFLDGYVSSKIGCFV